MDNEQTPLGFAGDSPNPPSDGGARDIIAERLAARLKREAPPKPSEPASDAPSVAPSSDATQSQSNESAVAEKPAFEKPILKLNPIVSASTDELQTTPPEPVAATEEVAPAKRERGDRPQRERGQRNRNNRDRPAEATERPARQPKPEQPEKMQPIKVDRDKKPSRPERSERNDRVERPPPLREAPRENKQPKTSENAFSRARNLASRTGVSVVIPLYNEQDSLRELTAAIREELFKLCERKYEIIFINDGSTDRSREILKDIAAASNRNIVLHFRSNLGKSAALSVGFKEAQYGIVITMDADLQDDPREFVNLIAKLDEGYDLVTGWKKKRNDPIGKTAPSKLFNSVTSFFSGLKLHDFNCGLKAYRKQVTDSLDVYGEMHRYLPALAHWQGYRVAEIPVMHHPRKFGKSKFGTSRFFKGFLDLLTIIFTNRYGRRPLHLFGTVGTLFSLIGLGINLYVSIEWIRGLTSLSNRPILLLGILLILVGVQLISIGLLGEMMVKSSARSTVIPVEKEKRKPRVPRPDRRAA